MKKPEIRVFAGPNGSGKSTMSYPEYILGQYINADVLKAEHSISDLDAAILAEKMREECINTKVSFTFETVLSTERNLLLLEKAKEAGYFIRCNFILTDTPLINVERVGKRVEDGGHDVPKDKIISRYKKALKLIPRLAKVCDRLNIYDNSLTEPIRILKKRDAEIFIFPNAIWGSQRIFDLLFVE